MNKSLLSPKGILTIAVVSALTSVALSRLAASRKSA
jgi:hypothetical protein